MDFVNKTMRIGSAFAFVAAILVCTVTTGCGNKEAEENSATTPPPAAGTTQPAATAPGAPGAAAPGTAPAPTQGKVTTGADPGKAPSYPSMYGKPAGSQ